MYECVFYPSNNGSSQQKVTECHLLIIFAGFEVGFHADGCICISASCCLIINLNTRATHTAIIPTTEIGLYGYQS